MVASSLVKPARTCHESLQTSCGRAQLVGGVNPGPQEIKAVVNPADEMFSAMQVKPQGKRHADKLPDGGPQEVYEPKRGAAKHGPVGLSTLTLRT